MNQEGDLIRQFAEKYGLKIRIDQDQTHIIPGKKVQRTAGHIYEYSDDQLGVMIVMTDLKGPISHYWRYQLPLLRKLNMQIVQNGDGEGSATFNPQNPAQSKLAIKIARVKPKRIMSDKQRNHAMEALQRAHK